MGKLPSETLKNVIVKRKEQSDSSYGCFPEDRPIETHICNAVINLDKPRGPTSHQVADIAKKILNVRKTGHGGTLDPAVTGILPMATDNATKIMPAMLYSGKEYVALMHLHEDVETEDVKSAMERLVGRITQLPPLRSHVKRVERQREVYYLEFLEREKRDILFRAGVEKGTYIRRLCQQIGGELKAGAHMLELRRTKAGGFTEKDNLVTLQDLEDAYAFWKEEGNEKFLRHCLQP
ncbi:MAG TPA: RNA-guided pseudouridylation complex pseudouridine synthase subunit Cbf5, partial [Candidatus Woesearchaeota archaeon]|nr:RNA-guided pseudouridylation complex pseudouridine synthase subunit Cbf5 [Candidatus Woesearchaeota archaeon]